MNLDLNDISIGKIMKRRLKKWTLENFWTHFGVLHYKQSPEFMIPAFHDYSYKMWGPPVQRGAL